MTTTPGQAPTGGAAAEQTGSYPAAASPLAPAQQAVVAGAPPVKQTERPHPLTPLIRGWLIFLAFVVYFLRDLVPDGSNDGLEVRDLGWILPLVGAVVVIAAVTGLF